MSYHLYIAKKEKNKIDLMPIYTALSAEVF